MTHAINKSAGTVLSGLCASRGWGTHVEYRFIDGSYHATIKFRIGRAGCEDTALLSLKVPSIIGEMESEDFCLRLVEGLQGFVDTMSMKSSTASETATSTQSDSLSSKSEASTTAKFKTLLGGQGVISEPSESSVGLLLLAAFRSEYFALCAELERALAKSLTRIEQQLQSTSEMS